MFNFRRCLAEVKWQQLQLMRWRAIGNCTQKMAMQARYQLHKNCTQKVAVCQFSCRNVTKVPLLSSSFLTPIIQVVINSPARNGWGETAQALHGELAQVSISWVFASWIEKCCFLCWLQCSVTFLMTDCLLWQLYWNGGIFFLICEWLSSSIQLWLYSGHVDHQHIVSGTSWRKRVYSIFQISQHGLTFTLNVGTDFGLSFTFPSKSEPFLFSFPLSADLAECAGVLWKLTHNQPEGAEKKL